MNWANSDDTVNWANSGRQCRADKPGMLQSMGLQIVRYDLAAKEHDNNQTSMHARTP